MLLWRWSPCGALKEKRHQKARERMTHTSLIVDECPMVQRGMKEFLESLDGMEVVGAAATAKEALRLARTAKPDIIFIEPNFTDNGLRRAEVPDMDLCREMKNFPWSPTVIIYTVHNYPADVAAAILVEADGYIHKSVPEKTIESAIESTLAGNPEWHYGLSTAQTQTIMHAAFKVSQLSRREKEILPLVLRRYSNKEIAGDLYIKSQSAQNHVASILRKLGYKNRPELYEAWGV